MVFLVLLGYHDHAFSRQDWGWKLTRLPGNRSSRPKVISPETRVKSLEMRNHFAWILPGEVHLMFSRAFHLRASSPLSESLKQAISYQFHLIHVNERQRQIPLKMRPGVNLIKVLQV